MLYRCSAVCVLICIRTLVIITVTLRTWRILQSVWESVLGSGIIRSWHAHAFLFSFMITSGRVTFGGVFRGLVRIKEQMYVIKPVSDQSDGDHVMYKSKHLRQKRNTFTFSQPPVDAFLKSSRWVMRIFKSNLFLFPIYSLCFLERMFNS